LAKLLSINVVVASGLQHENNASRSRQPEDRSVLSHIVPVF